MTDRIDLSAASAPSLTPTLPRATAPDAGQRFRDALAGVAGSVASGISALLPFAPSGLSSVAAVPASLTAGANGSGGLGAPTGAGAGSASLARDSADQAVSLLALQQQIGLEQRQFTTVSNVMKARHDTAKNVVGNFR